MATVRPDRGDSIYDGFPSPPLLRPYGAASLGPIRNGQPATGSPVRQLERAAIHLGCRRKCSYPALGSYPSAISAAAGVVSLIIALDAVEPYTEFVDLEIFYSTQFHDVSGGMAAVTAFGVFPAAGVAWSGTRFNTRADAARIQIPSVQVGNNAAADLALQPLTLSVSVTGSKLGTDSIYIYSVSIIPVDPMEIVV